MAANRRWWIVGAAVFVVVLGGAALVLRPTGNTANGELASSDGQQVEQQVAFSDSEPLEPSEPQTAALTNESDEPAAEPDSEALTVEELAQPELSVEPEPEQIEDVLTTAPSESAEKPEATEAQTTSTSVTSSSTTSSSTTSSSTTSSSTTSSSTTLDSTETTAAQSSSNPATPPPASSVAYSGVSATQWNEIATQRAQFGDPNDCRARVNSISSRSDVNVSPGDAGAIQRALDAGARVVLLQGGTHRIGNTIRLDSDQQLVGANGQSVTIDASGAATGVSLGSRSILANVSVINADNVGVSFGASGLAYRVSVKRAGYSPTVNSSGAGFSMHGSGSTNNCLVSAEALEGFNENGNTCAPCFNGGNADGVAVKFEARSNTIIDTHTYRNSDDGYDFWEGGSNYVYFGSSFDNGKTPGRPNGDGNGYKLGRGNATHYLYKVRAYTNVADGIDLNGNASPAVLVQTESTGNGNNDFDRVANR